MVDRTVVAGAGLFFDEALTEEGWRRGVRITLGDGLIASLEADASPAPGDERHACALPGMPNLHSHAFQRAMAGLAERAGPIADSFWTWRDTMYRFAQRITPGDLKAIADMAFVEMLESGFTRAGEFHYVHHAPGGTPYDDPAAMAGALVAAADTCGMQLTLLPVFYAHAGFGGLPCEDHQRRFVHDLDGFARLLSACETKLAAVPGAVLGLAPTACVQSRQNNWRRWPKWRARGPCMSTWPSR